MRREYKVECSTGLPQVNYREGITQRAEFNYLHKKQSGGSGQYGRVVGYVEPLTREQVNENGGKEFLFQNDCVGNENLATPDVFTCEKLIRHVATTCCCVADALRLNALPATRPNITVVVKACCKRVSRWRLKRHM